MTDERAIEDRIRARAHEIWEREGQPEGQDLRHWDEARLEIEAEERAGAASAATASGADIIPETISRAPNDDVPVETEASPSALDRRPM